MQVTTPLGRDAVTFAPSLFDRIGMAAAGVRDWLDARGRLAWIAAMVIGFVAAWPVGLGLLFYMIATRRLGGGCAERGSRHHLMRRGRGTGNSAFDAYRDETLRRLEDEHAEFLAFLARLREAKDKAEFDAFMKDRSEAPKPEEPAA
ncbi:DUF2852 domain-containing protein [Paracoccus suum]|uniref:DUF2852 domain-containing protein n=1 Tax=Paracoccus suum TaxID=2259340 RepID=A0A344PIW9_9RHOB|nr:DUF2852 domain-containing protein [Paracoccus suum]AXC49324.1 DUF2852 domain-containing protein [Paracoccus suum]